MTRQPKQKREERFEKVVSYSPVDATRFTGVFMVAIVSLFVVWIPDSDFIDRTRELFALGYTLWAIGTILAFFIFDYYIERCVTWRRIQ